MLSEVVYGLEFPSVASALKPIGGRNNAGSAGHVMETTPLRFTHEYLVIGNT
jgi:hypothetical protein